MKIIKHTFKIPQLMVVDGELIEADPKEETYTFTLLHGGIGRFEEATGMSLFAKMTEGETDEERGRKLFSDREFIINLTASAYVKIKDGKFQNDRSTMEEFKKMEIIDYVTDIDFLTKFFAMVGECMMSSNKKGTKKGKNA